MTQIVEEVYLKNRINNNPQAPRTFAKLVVDSAKNQTLDQTLINTPDKNTLGYPAFSTVVPYETGDVVYHLNKLWKFKVDHAVGAWNAAHVDETNIKDLVSEACAEAPESEIRAIVKNWTPNEE